ncbi:hypothetical protein [Alishewanella tabrizica]|uniref:Uncharacterized protein n=1 Tax=Alishewanella tabrizica TaxID=671278 RepID=A0ABQ2WJT7_9ALTE|nr:hypothetical protein [Alishewanella tabrizica]GGW54578.1 hypothetical protein GCM10008111_08180 [Alishewanella tabrizica]
MQFYTALDLSEPNSLDLDKSLVLRYGPNGISFYNREHDFTNYVNSNVPKIANAFWLGEHQRLLVQSDNHELHFLDTNAHSILKTETVSDSIKEIGISDNLLFACTFEKLMVISLSKASQLFLTQAAVRSLKDIIITNDNRYIGIVSKQEFSLYNLDGSKAVTFNRDNFIPTAAHRLSDNSWLTLEQNNDIFWWLHDGTEASKLPWSVDIHNGIRLLDNGNLLCTDGNSVIYEITKSGNLAAEYVQYGCEWSQINNIAPVAKGLHETIKALNLIDTKSNTNQKLTRFPHAYNLIGHNTPNIEDSEGQIIAGASIKRKAIRNPRIWSFFYRPIERTLRNQLADEMRAISIVDDQIANEDKSLRKLESEKIAYGASRNTIGVFWLLLLIASVVSAVWSDWITSMSDIPEFAPVIGIGLFAILLITSLTAARKSYRHAKEIASALKLLDTVKNQTIEFKSKVKNYRRTLLKQLMLVKENRISDFDMGKHVEEILSKQIRQKALDECGLDESEINSLDADGNEIRTYINEPGYLQFSDVEDIPPSINKTNLYSFYLDSDNKPIFAVQYIQYFFLGKNKIDAFTCFYDFINDEIFSNQSHTFYYRDVTNISKREIDLSQENGPSNLNNAKLGIEMKLVVASGDMIRINIATDETYREMNKEVDANIHQLNTSKNNIKDEIRQIEQNSNLSIEEKEEELNDLREALEKIDIDFSRRISETVSTHTKTSNQIIQHVRGRLKELKEL